MSHGPTEDDLPGLEEVKVLASRLLSDDPEQASQASEELVDLLLFTADDSQRQEQLGAIDEVRKGLVHLLCNGDEDGKYWSCLALSYIAHRNAVNIQRIGKTPQIFDGLYTCLGFFECKGAACGVLSQLAFCNKDNSEAIAKTPGLLERLVDVIQNGRSGDRQAATCALSNCAANSEQVALRIAHVPGMIEALKNLCTNAKPVEAEQGTTEDPRTVVSAIGCMDNLSHYPEVRPVLQAAGVDEVLMPTVGLVFPSEGSKVMAAESIMILTRLAHPDRLQTLPVVPTVLGTIVHCMRCAIDKKQWANFAWRLSDVLEPLARLTVNPSNRSALITSGAITQLLRALAMVQFGSSEDSVSERIQHSVQALVCLTEDPLGLRMLKQTELEPDDEVWVNEGIETSKTWTSQDILCKVVSTESLPHRLWVFRERHLALCMGHQARLGAQSPLAGLDGAMLREVLEQSCTVQAAVEALVMNLTEETYASDYR